VQPGAAGHQLDARAVDGRHAHTPLTRDLCQTVAARLSLLAWCGAARQFEYASLAPRCSRMATRDAEAARLLERAGRAWRR